MKAQRCVPGEIQKGQLKPAWDEILRNFYRFPLTELPEGELDKMTQLVWNNMTKLQRARLAFTSLLKSVGSIVMLAGLVTLAVDGGATLLAANALAASIPEIAVIVGTGFGLTGAMAGFLLGAIKLNTLPYLSRLFALSCDAFGVPRKINNTSPSVSFFKGEERTAYPLPDPGIPEQPVVTPLTHDRLWQEHNNLREIEKVLPHV